VESSVTIEGIQAKMTSASGIELHGHCDDRFAKVRETFAAAFASGAEIGAAVSVMLDGERVVDLWAGHADEARTRPWTRDTLVNVFSTTKGMTALCAHRLVDQGKLDIDRPVADYWPEFAARGKQDITVRSLLSHQAGLPAIRETLPPEAIFDWDRMASALADEEPWWTPDTGHGYHAVTFGWLVGEVVRRVSDRSLGTYFQEEIAGPLGADFFIGCGPELDERIADLVQGPISFDSDTNMMAEMMQNPDGMTGRAFMNPPLLGDVPMSRAWRTAEIPAANGHASAAAIATIYGAVARGEYEGVRVLSPEAVERAREEQVCGPDQVIQLKTRLANGFMLSPDTEPCGPNDRAFNHAGAGGSLGYCDPEARLGLGYTMNNMHMGAWLIDPRAHALVDATYESL
jgi:CubicO group peptidase (beta-lactamase class C family)